MTVGTAVMPTATVELREGQETRRQAACGDGPVDAIYRAIEQIVHRPIELVDTRFARSPRAGRPWVKWWSR